MSWVIRKDPQLPEHSGKGFSPWKGCIHILNGKPWYATSLAKPTKFDTRKDAEEEVERLRENYKGKFVIAVYEEIFQEKINIEPPPQASPSPPVPTKKVPSDWDF